MAKETYVYKGKDRPEKQGVKKSFDKKDLTDKKLSRLEIRGWINVVSKPKTKPKKKGSK